MHSKQLEACIDKISNGTYDDITINIFRTDLKRLKALFVFTDALSDLKLSKTDISCLKKLFKSAAILRDFQVVKKIIIQKKEPDLYQSFTEYLTENEELGKILLKKGLKKFLFKDLDKCFETIESSFTDLSNTDFRLKAEILINTKINLLSEHLKLCNDEKSFHKARIKVKEIVYFKEIINETISKKDKLTRMGQKMGRWHDNVVFRQMLERFIKKSEISDSLLTKELKTLDSDNKKKLDTLKSKLIEILSQHTF